MDETAKVGADGHATFSFEARDLERWSPDHPRLYQVRLWAGQDTLEDEMGFRTVEVRGTEILLNGSPIFCEACRFTPRHLIGLVAHFLIRT